MGIIYYVHSSTIYSRAIHLHYNLVKADWAGEIISTLRMYRQELHILPKDEIWEIGKSYKIFQNNNNL